MTITINNKPIHLIAEVKTKSPFGYVAEQSWDELFQIAEKVGDMISIHTDARWGGSFDLIKKAKSLTKKPILAKGIHEIDELVAKAIESGADFVLVVGRIPQVHLDRCLIEPNTLEELRKIPKHLKVVWNSRDLKTGGLKKETFAQAREIWNGCRHATTARQYELGGCRHATTAPLTAFTGWLCQASNIKTIADIETGADAVLVGEHLLAFAKSIG